MSSTSRNSTPRKTTRPKGPPQHDTQPAEGAGDGAAQDPQSADASALESLGAAISQPVRDAAAADSVDRALTPSSDSPPARRR